ncbi:MAG: TatD family hydrolase [Calditrichaceae bacterium]|nr:TatD family hydrolase [Calditrichaceae bacterium]
MFVDTHTHLDFDIYDEDREKVIQRAIENQVIAIITIGTDVETSKQAILLAEKYASIFASVGIHPSDCANVKNKDFQFIRELASHEKVVAIGEVGLDYYHMHAEKEIQHSAFKNQIQIARELNLPLIIHNRDSHQDMLKVLKEENVKDIGGVMHSFTGDIDFLEKIISMNMHVSFTGNITFKKSTSDDLVKKAPVENLLLETDSPFMTPVPLRGKRNEPAFIVHTAKRIAELKEIDLELLGRITTENAKNLFKIDI